jgi:hypothetical protein
MTAPTLQEVTSLIDGILESDSLMGRISDAQILNANVMLTRLRAHGIAPPDGMILVDWQTLDDACELLELHGEHEHHYYKALKATTAAAQVKP